MITLYSVDTVLGRLSIGEEEDAIVSVCFENARKPTCYKEGSSPLLEQAVTELEEYLHGGRKVFTLPLRPDGSAFMQEAWRLLGQVPYGQQRTYREQAVLLGRPNGARAVGLANSRNPIPIFIPCHRLVGSDGSLTGFRGGVVMKRWLLDLEGGRKPDTAALTDSLLQMRKNGGVMPVR